VAKRLIPLLDRVLIQKAEAVTKTKGGIVIPEKAQAKVLRGTVVAVGPGSRNQVYYYLLYKYMAEELHYTVCFNVCSVIFNKAFSGFPQID
jgi:hypothetical protein